MINESIALTKNAVKPTAIYCRVSTDNQEREGTSLDTQRAACLEYCQSKGYTVTNQFIETASGLSLQRSELDKLRELVRSESIEYVVIHCLDRFSRDPVDIALVTQELENHHVKLEAVIEDIDTSETGKLISYIRGYASKFEAQKIRERTMRGRRASVFDKHRPVTWRQVFGYDWVKVDYGKGLEFKTDPPKLIPNSDYETAKMILTWAIEGKSYDWIIAELKRRSINSPAGLPYWNKHTISALIRNPIYAGQYYALKSIDTEPKKRKGTRHGKTSQIRLPQDQWHLISEIEIVNPIITQDQRALLLDQVKQRQKLSQRNAKANYLLRGFVYCEHHHGVKGEMLRYHGQPYKKSYRYVCPAHKKNDPCLYPYINGPDLEEYIKLDLIFLFYTDSTDKIFRRLFNAEIQQNTKEEMTKEQNKLTSELDKLTIKMAKLEDGMLEGNIGQDEYKLLKLKYGNRKTEIKTRQDELLSELSNLERTDIALKSFEDIKYRLLGRMFAEGETEEEFKLLREESRKLCLKLGIPTSGDSVLDERQPPITSEEWRDLLSALNFRCIIGIKDKPPLEWPKGFKKPKITKDQVKREILYRHIRLEARLPIQTEVIGRIALHSSENGLHNQQYYPLRFSPADFTTSEPVEAKGGADG